MSKIEDLKKQYEKTKAEMGKLEEEIKKLEENKGKWIPKNNEKYFFVTNSLDTDWYINDDDFDKKVIKYNKVFRTDAEAQDYADYLKALKEASYEFTNEEWKNNYMSKYYIYYDYDARKLFVNSSYGDREQKCIYFKTLQEAKDFIGKYKKQILKYEFEIEE